MIRRLKRLTLIAALAAFAATAVAWHLGFDRWPPQAALAHGRFERMGPAEMATCFKAQLNARIGNPNAGASWQICRDWLAQYHAFDAFNRRAVAVDAGAAIGLLAFLGFMLCLRLERPSFKITRGARLYGGPAGRKAFARACATECRVHGPGLNLVPRVPLSRDRETRHSLILGSVGGGKTQTMLHLVAAAIARGDGILVLDTKGDMMAGLPAEVGPLLVAPHDRRSLVWDVAADCPTKQDARELAARFIPPSTDPMWSQAAQEIFVACIVCLQATKGRDWGWADLEAVVTDDVDALKEYARKHNSNAEHLLDEPESRTTLSILTTFRTHMRIVSVLAEAWPDPKAGRFSIRSWLHNPVPSRPLILQHDPGYPELSRIWIGSMLGLLASAVGSPTLSESRSRRIWLFLDEFPHLPAIKRFPTFLELGRSKGISVVISAQDTAQIRAVYGSDQAKAWFGMTGTKIMTRINASEAAEDVSRLIGDQEIERPMRSATHSGGRVSVTRSVQRESRRVITASELGSRLGPARHGVRVLFIGLGDAIYELELPYITLPKFREPIMPADWTLTPPPKPPGGASGTEPAAPPPRGVTPGVADRIRQRRR